MNVTGRADPNKTQLVQDCLVVPCPYCKAVVGELCRQQHRRVPHHARIKLFWRRQYKDHVRHGSNV